MPLFGYFTHRSPAVIGGTGGSGTRALYHALSAAGVFMGRRLNGAGDAMDFELILDETINVILSHTRSLNYLLSDLPRQTRVAMRRRFAHILSVYAEERPGAPGAEDSRSMYILPLIFDRCPGLRFIHLVRDGGEMAQSANQNQPKKTLCGSHRPSPPGRPRGWLVRALEPRQSRCHEVVPNPSCGTVPPGPL